MNRIKKINRIEYKSEILTTDSQAADLLSRWETEVSALLAIKAQDLKLA